MKNSAIKKISIIILAIIWGPAVFGQTNHLDTIYASSNLKKPSLGSWSYTDYLEKDEISNAYAKEVIAVKLEKATGLYEVLIGNYTTNETQSITKIYLKNDNLQTVSLFLKATCDSAAINWVNDRLVGWAHYPPKEPFLFNEVSNFKPFTQSGNVPWYLGVIRYENMETFILPIFNTFTGSYKWSQYMVLGKERITAMNKEFDCWKIDAGRVGPPGYNKTVWIDSKSGLIIKSELIKDSSSPKYVMVLEKEIIK